MGWGLRWLSECGSVRSCWAAVEQAVRRDRAEQSASPLSSCCGVVSVRDLILCHVTGLFGNASWVQGSKGAYRRYHAEFSCYVVML